MRGEECVMCILASYLIVLLSVKLIAYTIYTSQAKFRDHAILCWIKLLRKSGILLPIFTFVCKG